jgi:membrane protein required for colicin V production
VILDIVLLLMLAGAAFNGWRMGAMAMIISVAVLAVALIAGSSFAAQAGDMLHIGPDWLRPIIGFLFVFLVVIILGNWVKRFFRPKTGILRGLDGLVGAALGFLRGLLVLSIFLAVLRLVHFPPAKWTERSHVYPGFLHVSTWISGGFRHLVE